MSALTEEQSKKLQSDMDGIKDRIQQWEDGFITGYEAFQTINALVAGMDVNALQAEHDGLLEVDQQA